MRKGQALVVALLTMGVVAVIGMSLVSRTQKDVGIATSQEESQRALRAAESGLEESFAKEPELFGFTGTLSQLEQEKPPQYTTRPGGIGGSNFIWPARLHDGEEASVNLVGYGGKKVTVCWGDAEYAGGDIAPSIQVKLYGTRKSPMVYHPIGYYKFNEGLGLTTADSAVYPFPPVVGQDGTLVAGPVWQSSGGMYPALGNYLSFDKTDDRVSVGSPAKYDNMGSMTIAAWIRLPSISTIPSYNTIATKRSGSSPFVGWNFRIHWTAIEQPMQLAFYSDANLAVFANYSFSLNTWYHVALVWDGTTNTSGVKFYVNGTLIPNNASSSGSGSVSPDQDQNLLIGNASHFTHGFGGHIDDVWIFDTEITPAQLMVIKEYGLVGTGYRDGQAGYTDNNFTGFSTPTMSCPGVGTYLYSAVLDFENNFNLDSTMYDYKILKVRLLNTRGPGEPVMFLPESDRTFPTQGKNYFSVGQTMDVKQELKGTVLNWDIPPMFDTALFSGKNLSK